MNEPEAEQLIGSVRGEGAQSSEPCHPPQEASPAPCHNSAL